MTTGEIYLKLAVGFADDPKVRALARYGVDGILARDLYVQMCLYCKRVLTDGHVPEEQLGLLVYPLPQEHGKQLAKQLAVVGLINEEANGWTVLAYVRRNGTKADVEALSVTRAESGRRGGLKSRKPARQKPAPAKPKQVASGALKQNEARDRVSSLTTEPSNEGPVAATSANADQIAMAEVTTRAKPITDAYYAAQPMCKWVAINGIVIHAIKTRKYTDDVIQSALLRMAADGTTVTIESLRVEIEGFRPRDRPSRQQSEQAQLERAMQRANAREGQS